MLNIRSIPSRISILPLNKLINLLSFFTKSLDFRVNVGPEGLYPDSHTHQLGLLPYLERRYESSALNSGAMRDVNFDLLQALIRRMLELDNRDRIGHRTEV